MVPELPSFLRRRLRLHEARKALLGGAPEEALRSLDDRALLLSAEADRLRERVLDVLCREAFRQALEGQRAEAQRRLDLVDERDPARAEGWRRRLAEEAGASRSGISRAGESQILTALEGLLAEMRSKQTAGAAPASGSGERRARRASNGHVARPTSAEVQRFQLAVDDAGEYLVVTGDAVLLGHAQAGRADLPFLADLDARHALLRRGESFHGGPTWTLGACPEGGAPGSMRIDGRELAPGGETLADGCVVQLASNLSFRFRAPEPGSGSAVLELLRGAECLGAQRVLLLAPGASGRMRFGTRARRHVVLRGQECEVTLELQDAELVIASDAGLGASSSGPARRTEVRLACPPPERVDFVVGQSVGSRPPFGFSIIPLEDPA